MITHVHPRRPDRANTPAVPNASYVEFRRRFSRHSCRLWQKKTNLEKKSIYVVWEAHHDRLGRSGRKGIGYIETATAIALGSGGAAAMAFGPHVAE